MHPSDGLFGGWEVVYAVGVLECLSCFLGGAPWLPPSFVLDEWDAVTTLCITGADEEGFALVGDEYVSVFVHSDAGLGKDRNGPIVAGFTYAHEGLWEIGK
jgi:hypothetical protein